MIESRGHLNPGDPDVVLTRLQLANTLDDLVRHVWIGTWSLPAGARRTQRTLTYPGCNAVMMAQGAALYGPAPRVAERDLVGNGWVVGVLLQPAATCIMSRTLPRQLVGTSEPLEDSPWRDVRHTMEGPRAPLRELRELLEPWLSQFAQQVDDAGRLANTICRVAETDATVRSVHDLAGRVGMAQRTLHRLLTTRVGLSAKWLIERRRLQDAAAALRQAPDVPLAELAAELGYADQAHFTKRFREIVGRTPGQARQGMR